MNFKIVKNIAKATCAFAIALTAMNLNTIEAQAQDLIARQAPIDRKMKAADSVVINRAIKQQPKQSNLQEINFEQTDLYSTWNTSSVHCYANQTAPEKYRIDLRGFAMPTPSRVITSNFGYRASFGRMHKGIDVKVYIGDTIVSAFDGKVRIVNYEAKGYGNYIVVRHNNGLETIYGHLSKHLCKVGDVVRAGQPIGLGGNTGRSTGSHLHFETRIVGEAINPALLFDFVHQDVTCDFYEYRRGGGSSAGTRTQTAAKPASTPKTNPAPAAKPAQTPAVKVETPSKSQKESTPAKTPKEAVAKVTTKSAITKNTQAAAKNVTASQSTKTTAQTPKSTAKSSQATAQASKAPAKTTDSKTVSTKTVSSAGAKATAKAAPAKSGQNSKNSSAKKSSSKGSNAKSQPSKSNSNSVKTTGTSATAKAAAPKSNASSGHSKKA